VTDKNYKNLQEPVASLQFKLVTSRIDVKSFNPCATNLNPFILMHANQEVIYKDVMPQATQCLTLNLLTTTIFAPHNNASKWQMGFNSAFKGLN